MGTPPRTGRDLGARSGHARPARDPRLDEVLAGLRERPRRISPKWFYDEAGSLLFERITRLPEYYLTRTEAAIFDDALPEIARLCGRGARVVEPGPGSGVKTERILAALDASAYTAIEVSEAALAATMARVRARFPRLPARAVIEDFTSACPAPDRDDEAGTTLVFFPGSTLGNFDPGDATALLARFRRLGGARGKLLLGVDLAKDEAVLIPAYDDAAGVTAEFNRNALRHLNEALGADFAPERFRHRVRFDTRASRIEMHLESVVAQRVRIGGDAIDLVAGEWIHTENSYKHERALVERLATSAGWTNPRVWTDPLGWFGVFLFDAA